MSRVYLVATKCMQCKVGNCTRKELVGFLGIELNMTLEILDCDMKEEK